MGNISSNIDPVTGMSTDKLRANAIPYNHLSVQTPEEIQPESIDSVTGLSRSKLSGTSAGMKANLVNSSIPAEKTDLGFDALKGKDTNLMPVTEEEQEQGITPQDKQNEVRAENQSNWEKLGNSLTDAVGIAATTTVSAAVGLPVGLVSAAIDMNDPSKTTAQALSKIYNNPVTATMDNLQRSLEDKFPILYTREEQNASALSPDNWFTMNFLTDKILKNLGYMGGFLIPGALAGKTALAIGKLATAGKYAEELAVAADAAKIAMDAGEQVPEAMANSLEAGARIQRLNSAIQATTANAISATTEASMFARQGREQAMSTFLNKFYQDQRIEWSKTHNSQEEQYMPIQPTDAELKKMDDLASAAGNATFVLNAVTSLGANFASFGKTLLSGKTELQEQAINRARSLTYDETAPIGEAWASKTVNTPLNKALIIAKSPAAQSLKMGLQQTYGDIATDYYAKRFDGTSQGQTTDAINAVSDGLTHLFGSKSGVESLLIGAVTGMLTESIPHVGNMWKEFEELRSKDQLSTEDAIKLNDTARKLYNEYHSPIETTARAKISADQLIVAREEGDIKKFKDAQNDLLKNYVQARVDAGQTDAMIDDIKSLHTMPGEELSKLFDLKSDPVKGTPTAEIFLKNVLPRVQELAQLRTSINTRFPGDKMEGVRDQLYSYAADLPDITRRMNKIKEDLSPAIETKIQLDKFLKGDPDASEDKIRDALKLELPLVDNKNPAGAWGSIQDYVELARKKQIISKYYSDAISSDKGLSELTEKANARKSIQNLTTALENSRQEDIKNKQDQNSRFIQKQTLAGETDLERQQKATADEATHSQTTTIPEAIENITVKPKETTAEEVANIKNPVEEVKKSDEGIPPLDAILPATNQNKEVQQVTTENTGSTVEEQLQGEQIKSVTEQINDLEAERSQRLTDLQNIHEQGLVSDEKYPSAIEAIHNNVNQRRASIDPEFNELKQLAAKLEDPNQITEDTAHDIDYLIGTSIEETSDKNSQGGEKTDEQRVMFSKNSIFKAASSIAMRFRNASMNIFGGTRKYIEDTNELNPQQELSVLNPEKYHHGTEVTLKISDHDGENVYWFNSSGEYETTSWGVRKQHDTELYSKNKKGELELDFDKWLERVPIRIEDKSGKLIGYLHELGWLTEDNVAGDLKTEQEQLSSFRKKVHETGDKGLSTIIVSKGWGKVFREYRRDKIGARIKSPVYDNIKDPDRQIAVGVAGSRLKLGRGANNVFDGKLANSQDIRPGISYIVAPVGRDNNQNPVHMALPATSPKLGEAAMSEGIIKSIMTAIRAHLNLTDYTLSEADREAQQKELNSFKESILNIHKLNIDSYADLGKYLAHFLNLYNLGGSRDFKTLLTNAAFLSTHQRTGRSNANLFTIKEGNIYFTDHGIENYISKGSPDNIIDKNGIADNNYRETNLKKLEKILPQMFLNTHIDAIGDDSRIVMINKDGISDLPYREFNARNLITDIISHKVDEINGKDIHSYTYQPTIRIDLQGDKANKPAEITRTVEEVKLAGVEPEIKKETIKTRKHTFTDTDQLPGNLDGLDIFKISEDLKKHVIEELGLARQEEITDMLKSDLTDQVLEHIKKKGNLKFDQTKFFEDQKADFIDDLEDLTKQLKENPDSAIVKKAYDAIKTTVDNWDKIIKITIAKFNEVRGIRVNKDIDEENPDYKEDIDLDTDVANEKQHDLFAYQQDPRSGVTQQVRLFLNGIGEYRLDGKPKLNFFTKQSKMKFDEVYNSLQMMTSNLPHKGDRLQSMINSMMTWKLTHPWVEDVVKRLEVADTNMQNMFVKAMSLAKSNTQFRLWEIKKDGTYDCRTIKSNSNELTDVIRKSWLDNLIMSKKVSVDNRQFYQMSETDKFEFNNGYQELIFDLDNNFQATKAWAESVGLILHDATWQQLKTEGAYYGGQLYNWKALFQQPGGIFRVLNARINNINNEESIIDRNPFEDRAFNALALIDSKYRKNLYTTSYQSGGRTIWGFGQNNAFTDTITNWQKNYNSSTYKGYPVQTNTEFTKRSKIAFSVYSLWLKQFALLDRDGKFQYADNGELIINPKGLKLNIDYTVADLQPMKKKGSSNMKGKELSNIGGAEHEAYKIAGLQNDITDQSGLAKRIISVMIPTAGDKTTSFSINTEAAPLRWLPDGRADENAIYILYDQLVRPEIAHQKLIENLRLNGKLQEINHEALEKHSNLFYIIPELNDPKHGLRDIKGNLIDNIDSKQSYIEDILRKHLEDLVDNKLAYWKDAGIGEGRNAFLNDKYLSTTLQGIIDEGGSNKNRIRAAATDMVYQYLIANANFHMLLLGHPAEYFKSKAEDYLTQIKDTFDNVTKRVTAIIAPGADLTGVTSELYKQAVVHDIKINSQIHEFMEKLLGKTKGRSYKSIKGTDSQELTTVKEHLRLLDMEGNKLPVGLYSAASKLIDAEISKGNHYYNSQVMAGLDAIDPTHKFSKAYKTVIKQPMKPRYFQNILDDILGVSKSIYIKSSSYALDDETTRGLDIDNIRIAMENPETGVDRLAFDSAVKLGIPSGSIDMWDEDGYLKDNIDFSNCTLSIPRDGFKIQQDIPLHDWQEGISKSTQASKNLLVNMLGVKGFQHDGKEWTGKELQKEYHDIYNELYKHQKDQLYERLGLKSDKDIASVLDNKDFLKNLRKIIQEEIIDRNYPLADADALDLDKDLSFIGWSNASDKIEAVLNSLVSNNIIKLEMPGKSDVLSSEEGYKNARAVTDKDYKNSKILWSDKFDSKIGLKPARIVKKDIYEKTGKEEIIGNDYFEGNTSNALVLPAQVILPWRFSDHEGNPLDMENFKDEHGFMDNKKLPVEVREIFSMRIPNMGPNYQSSEEVVGYLPVEEGNRVICSRDEIVKMGHDFDVDKKYQYIPNVYYDQNTGRLHKIINISKDKFKSLQNKLIDIHRAIHANPDLRVQKQLVEPASYGDIPDRADWVYKNSKQFRSNVVFSPLSDDIQRQRFLDAMGAKNAVANFAAQNTFYAICQGKNLIMMEPSIAGQSTKDIEFNLGHDKFNGNISTPFTLKTQQRLIDAIRKETGIHDLELLHSRGLLDWDNINPHDYIDDPSKIQYKSDRISAWGSIAVDNMNEQKMYKVNANKTTLSALNFLNAAGFEDNATLLISQDIVFDYVKALEKYQSAMTAFTPDARNAAMNEVFKKYSLTESEQKQWEYLNSDLENYDDNVASYMHDLTDEKLKEMIEESQNSANYNLLQRIILNQFFKADELGRRISDVQSITNIDSKGLNPSLLATIEYEDRLKRLLTCNIVHAEDILGQFDEYGNLAHPTTINGQAIFYGLLPNNKLWSSLFPYTQEEAKTMFSRMIDLFDNSKAGLTKVSDIKRQIWNNLKSYLYTHNDLGLIKGNVDDERRRLLIDTAYNKSIATISKEIQDRKDLRDITLLGNLSFSLNKNGQPSLVKFNAASKESYDELSKYTSMLNMLVNPKPLGEYYGNPNYNTRDYAEDLIKAAYLNGGIQEATQYVKYIPSSYLYTIPFAKKLSDITKNLSFNDPDCYIKNPSEDMPYWKVSPYELQYAQHFLDSNREVEPTDIIPVEGTRETGDLSSFALSSKEYCIYKNNQQLFPVFLKLDKRLYMYQGESYKSIAEILPNEFIDSYLPKYRVVDTLGTPFTKEYNANVEYQRSLYDFNHPESLNNKTIFNFNPEPAVMKELLENGTVTVFGKTEDIKEVIGDEQAGIVKLADNKWYNVETFKDPDDKNSTGMRIVPLVAKNPLVPLDPIVDSKSEGRLPEVHEPSFSNVKVKVDNDMPYYQKLGLHEFDGESEHSGDINDLDDVLTKLSTLTKDPYHKELSEMLNKFASYHINNNKDYFSFDAYKDDTPGATRGLYDNESNSMHINTAQSDHDLEETILHETMHGVMNRFMTMDEKELENQSGDIKRAVKRLKSIRKDYENTLDPKEFTQFKKDLDTKGNLTKDRISKFYGAINDKEFLSMLMEDKDFQKILNDIPWKESVTSGKALFPISQTFWDRVIEATHSLFKALGIPMKEHSTLAVAMKDVMDLMKSDPWLDDEQYKMNRTEEVAQREEALDLIKEMRKISSEEVEKQMNICR